MSDLRFGLRLLAKSPVFAGTAILLLAIGIGANTIIFSVVNALLLRPLPVAHPENLVRLVEVHPTAFVTWDLPYNFCDAIAAQTSLLSTVICQGEADVPLSDGESTERVRIHFVSPNFFSTLGVNALFGRVLHSGDERSASKHAVLSFRFWQRKFHGDPNILGRGINLGGHSFTVVGVSPESFNGLTVDTSPDIRVPASVDRALIQPSGDMAASARPLFGQIFARLAPNVTLETANASIHPLLSEVHAAEIEKIFPSAKDAPRSVDDSRLRLESVATGVSTLRPQFTRSLQILMAGVGLLLLMACANVAGLLLARSATRTHEISIRRALGASPARIVRQLLTEGLILSVLSGAAGILLTLACLPLLLNALPPIRDRGAVLQPLSVDIGIDLNVLAFAVGITILATVFFALSPALRSAGTAIAGTIRSARGTTRRMLAGHVIVGSQIAICTLILIGAALLVQTLQHMRSMNPGFDSDRVVTFTIDPSLKAYSSDRIRSFSKSLLEGARNLPSVTSAGIASRALMRGTGVKATFVPAGAQVTSADFLNCSLNGVTPDYFATMGMHLVAGSLFSDFDNATQTPRKVIVNQAFVKRFFPNVNPIGQRFGAGRPGVVATAGNEILGVVNDAKYRSLREPVPPTVYNHVGNGFDSTFVLHVRTPQDPETMINPVRELVRSLDAQLPIVEVSTLREEVDASLWQERLLALLSVIFGSIAALLACIGLYGALDYAVKSRTREIGVRIAVGAQPSRIVALFSKDALFVTVGGVSVGLCLYAMATVWIRRLLYDLHPWEPIAILSAVLLVIAIAALATAPAVFRAVRTDAASALRAE